MGELKHVWVVNIKYYHASYSSPHAVLLRAKAKQELLEVSYLKFNITLHNSEFCGSLSLSGRYSL